MSRQHSTERFISKLKSMKPFIRLKDGEVYQGSFHKLNFICSMGHEFSSSPSNILNSKHIGCKKCSSLKLSVERLKCPTKFEDEFYKVHPEYKLIGEYKSCFQKVEVLCDKGHTFSSRANDLISGTGCNICRTSGYKDNLPGTLYYLKVTEGDKVYYKIGITNLSIRKRFNNNDLSRITVLMEEFYEDGYLARLAEKQVLAAFKDFLAKDVKLLKKGNTELFVKDVLCLDV